MPDRRPTRLAQSLRNNATPAERHLWRHLSRRQLDGHKFSRQMPVGPFVCDFMCREARLVIEVDGALFDGGGVGPVGETRNVLMIAVAPDPRGSS